MSNADEPFLKRWSRRKIEALDQPPKDADPSKPVARDEGAKPEHVTPLSEASAHQAERALTEADFADVDFDALNYQSDYTRFVAPGVPESIKRKALQKLWASDPVFNQIDPLQDYAGDFTDKAVAVPAGTLKTAYRIGRGFMTDEEVAAWEKLGKPPEAETDRQAGPADDRHPAASAAPATQAAVTIAGESPDQPDIHALLRLSDAYFADLYPAESNHLVNVDTLTRSNVRFLVARRGGGVIGCGALVLAANAEAEIKRMFVLQEARGTGLGSAILDALEAVARREGVRVIRLETGVRQPAALALYRRHGYYGREPFGGYANDPRSVFMEKWLD